MDCNDTQPRYHPEYRDDRAGIGKTRNRQQQDAMV